MNERNQKRINRFSRLQRYTKHTVCRGPARFAHPTTMEGMKLMNSVYASSTDYNPHEDTSGGATGTRARVEQLQGTEPGEQESFKLFLPQTKHNEANINVI